MEKRTSPKAKPQQSTPGKAPPIKERPGLPESIVHLRHNAIRRLAAAVEAGAEPDRDVTAAIPRHLIAAFQSKPLGTPMPIRPADYLRQVDAKLEALAAAAIGEGVQVEIAERVLRALEDVTQRLIPLYELAHDLATATPPRAVENYAARTETHGDICEIFVERGNRRRAGRRAGAVRS